MFTGIVQEVGKITGYRRTPTGAAVTIEAPKSAPHLRIGDSISTAGACLTCTDRDEDSFTADLSRETMALTTLGSIRPGTTVNLELAMTLSDRLGGHLLTGHIDGTGTVRKVVAEGKGRVMTISAPDHVARYLIPKGSIAVDGVSLTVADIDDAAFSIALIPHTLEQTTLSALKPGHRVNLEADLIGKYVERLLMTSRPTAGGLLEALRAGAVNRQEEQL